MRKPQRAYGDSLLRDIFNNADRLLEIHLRVVFWGKDSMTKNVHVMVAFVSQLANNPTNVEYRSVDGKEIFSCMQTNEAAVCQLQSLLRAEGGLAKIILIETDQAREKVTRNSADWLALMEKYGSESMSAVELLKAQSARKYPELAQVFEDSEYSKMGIEDSMRSIAGIAERVRAFAERVHEKEPEAELVLHADMTGGFRYAAMMLLVVMQLSKYMGIRMGHVVYSDLVRGGESRVHLTDDIRRMFDLVAGADEFQKYGSVQALEEYFSRSPRHSEDFSTLFAAMRRFSDAIRICRTSVIEDEMTDLAEKIRAFRQSKPASIEEEMFSHILGVIEGEYGSVIKNASGEKSDRRLDIIAWCVQKKFLQQAMTLCTEWIPAILVEKKICYTEDEEVIEQCQERGDSGAGMRSWQQEFINSYGQVTESKEVKSPTTSVPEGDFHNASFKEMTNLLRTILSSGVRTRVEDLPPEMKRGVQSFFAAYDEIASKWRNYDLRQMDFRTRNAIIDRTIAILHPSPKKKFFHEEILRRLAGSSNEDIFTALGIDGKKCGEACARKNPTSRKRRTAKKQQSPEEKWLRREACYRRMLSGHGKLLMYTQKATEEAVDFLRGFYFIRQGRNDTNHAAENAPTARRNQGASENDRLEEEIAAYIERLRNA